MGLSPRARGNRRLNISSRLVNGPIPAGAGEPILSGPNTTRSRAYPRGRGGTRHPDMGWRGNWGLSPRARGNRGRSVSVAWAYPRGRGGTHVCASLVVAGRGLSPRARGNRFGVSWRGRAWGPIPAGAGEPGRRSPMTRTIRAYPRGRGGTIDLAHARGDVLGLSPRARGNQVRYVTN